MSATTDIRTPARTARATLISRTLKAEWTKLRTLPSTWRTATLTLALGIGFGVASPVTLLGNVVSFEPGQRIFASQHVAVTIGHPAVLRAIFFGAVAVSLVAVIGVGIGGLIRHTAGAATTLALIIIGGLTVGQFLPTGWRQYMPGIATQAAVTVHRSAGLLHPGTAIVVLAVYAALTLGAASLRVAHRDA